MGKVVGATVGVVVGFVMGLLAMSYLNERVPQTSSPSTPAEQNPGYAETYLVCKWDVGNRESTLVIKGDRSGAKTMTISWNYDESDEYRVEQTTDFFFKAVKAKPTTNEARFWLEPNRVTGELFLTGRYVSDNTVVAGSSPRAECRSADRRF